MDEYARKREEMVRETIVARDVRDPEVIAAMLEVPRHLFVPEVERSSAYSDRPLPIGFGQTISQPYIVAFMAQEAKKGIGESRPTKVLEIGTGCGYSAAVLSRIFDLVFSVEIIPPLAESASKRLKELGYNNVLVKRDDGNKGWPEEAPFDAIVVTAAPRETPDALLEQLKIGGRMVIPVGPLEYQVMKIIERISPSDYRTETAFPVRFVPMTKEGEV